MRPFTNTQCLSASINRPETNNQSYRKIDALYANRVSPHKFKDFAFVDSRLVESARKCGLLALFIDKNKHVRRGIVEPILPNVFELGQWASMIGRSVA